MTDTQLFSFLYAKSKFRVGNPSCWRRTPRLSICVLIFSTVLFTLLPQHIHACMRNADCGPNGVCDTGVCVCDPGWQGSVCEQCNGRTRLQESSGYIIEAVDNYDVRTKCTWLIDGGRSGAIIRFILQEFGTECSWDYLFIYDGDSIYSPLVASLNGPVRHDGVDIRHEIVTTSGFAYLYFYSDAAFNLDGFNISYSINSCPGNGCSGHGICDSYHLNCSCDPLWTGESCDIPACPSNCSGQGYCDADSHACVCNTGFKGRDCDTLAEDGLWEIREGAVTQGRSAGSTTVVGDDLWVIGGYTYEERENLTVTRYNFLTDTTEWIQASSESGVFPKPRYSHTAVLYEETFIMYGGSFFGSGLTAEVWSFHHPTRTWSNMTDAPYVMEGHTAHVIDDVMVVIFGYSPIYSYANLVQEYNITSGEWSVVETGGAAVKGSYGHASVYDPEGKKIYVHGGYKLKTGSDHMLSDDTYQYDVITKSWRILKGSLQPRFLHSAVVLNGLLLVFGGNTHTDGTRPMGAKCYSSNFLAYNLECGSWETINVSSGLENEISRFGHSAFIYQGSMWIYSGYNGLLTTSALLYNPGNCSLITNSSECMDGLPGLWCAWDLTTQACVLAYSVPGLASNDSICPEDEGPHCGAITNCQSCVETPGCGYCNGNCTKHCADDIGSLECEPPVCSVFTSCRLCNSQNKCSWTGSTCQYKATGGNPASCDAPCEYHADCASCLPDGGGGGSCMWCQSQQRCVDSNSYMTSFPYGLCLEWRTSVERCPKTCADYQTCGDCHADPACGWCDSGSRNGLGHCVEGSYSGPMDVQGSEPVLDYDLCPADRWYFVQCPSCQCNGHSTCPQNSSECGSCQDFTEGDQCETCQLGYYGQPQNGGYCAPCSCNGHSDVCHQTTGNCYCDAKGVVGAECDRCDTSTKYYGNPEDGGYCYYKLLMNWQYTFNLSDDEEKNYTSIAMMTSPTSPSRDIEFILQVSKPVYLNITYTARDVDGEQTVVEGTTVEATFRRKLSRYDFDFSEEGNTTFFFYLSNFTTPISFQVAQYHPLLNWVTVLVAFFVCFLSLLLIFLAGLKIKDRYDRVTRTRRRAVEMAVMASRPFAAVNVEVSKSAPPDLVAACQNYQVLAALEPCNDNKAGIMTVFMQLPMGEGEAPPHGQPRLTLASALVQLKPKKAELREQRGRERDQRERERETRARERESREREAVEQLQQTQTPPPSQPQPQPPPPSQPSSPEPPSQTPRQQIPVAPLAVLPPDDILLVSPGSEEAQHIRHHAEYDNPAMTSEV